MPGTGFGGWGGEQWMNITDFIKNGSIPESRVDDMIIRTLTPYFWLGQDTAPLPDVIYVRLFSLHHLIDDQYEVNDRQECEFILRSTQCLPICTQEHDQGSHP